MSEPTVFLDLPRVRCDNFNCGATTKEQPSEELAVAAWNRRGAR